MSRISASFGKQAYLNYWWFDFIPTLRLSKECAVYTICAGWGLWYFRLQIGEEEL